MKLRLCVSKLARQLAFSALWLSGFLGVHVDASRLRRSANARQLANSTRTAQEDTVALSELFPFYHTSQGIHDELVALASRCPELTVRTAQASGSAGQTRDIDVVTVAAEGSTPVNRNFLLFGEHARELISPESGLHFLKSLCGETSLADKAKDVLRENHFQVVVNGNPGSRRQVENGEFCLRVNPEGTDLNRNWDEKWEAQSPLDAQDTNPGPSPFSEPETRIFKELVQAYEPTTFLTVHSGTKGMYMPWAYDMEHLANRNQPQMMEVLRELDKDHCQCPFGAAGKEVGYPCPGTCLDWVFDNLKGTQYSFAFEIYVGSGEDDLKARWEQKMSQEGSAFLQEHGHLANEHFKDFFADHPSSFVQLKAEQNGHRTNFDWTNENCFRNFNPADEDDYKRTVENWSSAYLDMAAKVAAKLKTASLLQMNSSSKAA
mmetsp:Transcript_36698/g.84444  ORF Transcript_36698/g.84444 Transcript_36698/m.84444 type:complete len:433 (-) Transcript_36698:78-1376(-)